MPHRISAAVLALLGLARLCGPVAAAADSEFLSRTYVRLDAARELKRAELTAYLQRTQRLADSIVSDRCMAEFFRLKRRYYQAAKQGKSPDGLKPMMENLKAAVREHYMRNYMAFYDILCVDRAGDIFYTVRGEKDYHQNLFAGDLAKTDLSLRLKDGGRKTFVDYQYYAISDEPSAFFVEPVLEGDELLGWFVLQCTVNKINSMFSQDADLGATGEVILVNRQQYMLTDSRFFGDSSILKRHLSPRNIEEKFREGRGHKIVTDYRGFRAITSFETCPVGDDQWLLIAKIDEDEIVTEEYLRCRTTLSTALLRHFQEQPPRAAPAATPPGSFSRVDMDEFRKVEPPEAIGTFGVSSCTAAAVSHPGRFAYLAHISNFDRIYGMDGTDLIGNMFKRIRDFDISRSELRNLRVTLAAPHLNSLLAAIDRLLQEGVLLSQIRFLYRRDAEYGMISHSSQDCRTFVKWKINQDGACAFRFEDDAEARSLGDIVKELVAVR